MAHTANANEHHDRETDALLTHQSSNGHNNNYNGTQYTNLSNNNQPKQHPTVGSALSRLKTHLKEPLHPRHGDLILLYCYIITGLLDSTAVSIWGAFVSMQTGNTVYLGLGLASDSQGNRWIKSGVSIASFCVGSAVFGSLHRFLPVFTAGSASCSPRQRGVLCASFLIQMVCVLCAAVIATVVKEQPPSSPSRHSNDGLAWWVLVPLALVAFQSSGQAVTSRVLNQPGLSSVVLTSIYCDLFSHPDLLSCSSSIFRNVQERRRAGAVVCFLVGAVLGGAWARTEVGLMGALWTAVVLKALIVVMWLVWRVDGGDNEGEVQP